jgi:ATP-binding cassette, subfamily B, bacterial MsbA
MRREAQAIQLLLPLLRLYPWAIPTVVFLGILSSLSEGLGISLFIPFLQSFDSASAAGAEIHGLVGVLNQLFQRIEPSRQLLIIPLFIFGSILLKNALTYGNGLLFSWLNGQISHRLRSDSFKQLLSVSYGFLETQESGKLLNTLATETWQVSRALAVLVGLITSLCTVVVFVVLLFLISWRLTLLVALIMACISLGIRTITRNVKRLGQAAVEANTNLAKRMWEGLAGMRVIRAFGQEPYEQQRFDRASTEVRTVFLRLDILSTLVNPLFEISSAALLVCMMVLALQDRTTLPTLLTFIFLLYRLQPQVKSLENARVGLTALTSSVAEVMAFLDRGDKPYIRSGSLPFRGLRQGISLESVSFSYNPEEKPALQDVSIQIPCGKTTALVGPSGAGKSTLINLICRFYDATAGEIYVDDLPLRQLDLTSWRRRIAIVSQDVHMFSTTIRDNILYGRLEASEAEVVAAAKQANAHEFILGLPRGYDTKVGDRGIRLSGGQRQRIALARAIIRQPQILILDEATNALDSISEHLIQEALQTFSQNRTVIVIAHRLSTIEEADQIVVLKAGQVLEQGTLPQLLTMNGLFAQLYRLQYSAAET